VATTVLWMSADTWQTAVNVGRWTNILLAAVTLGVLITTIRGWRTRSAGNRFLWWGVILFLVNTVYGSAEQLYQGAAGGFRTAVTTVAVVYVLAAVILKRMGRWHAHESPYRPNGGSPRA
jgi:uncharacterized membrane protein YvlD (DUF360 family)